MRPRILKILSAVICLAVALTSVMLIRTELHGSKAEPKLILYHNDRVWSRSTHPAQVNDKGVYYAPLTFFVQLNEVKARINETLQTFIITHGDLYLSFDIATNNAANQDQIRIPLRTYEYEGERYVPLDAVCYYLELGLEIKTSPYTGDVAIRVTDGNEQFTFPALLRRRHPGFLDDLESSTADADTTRPVTTAPKPVTTRDTEANTTVTTAPPKLTDRIIYITVEDSPGEYTEDILEVLREYNCKATFFVIGSQLPDNISTLMKIVSEGHTLGLHTMNHSGAELTSVDDILADIEAENELLAKITKQKSRLWSAPNGAYTLRALNSEARRVIGERGYIVWDSNVNVLGNARSAQTAANDAIRGIWANPVCSLRFVEGEHTAETLRAVLDFINKNADVCDVRVASPSFENN